MAKYCGKCGSKLEQNGLCPQCDAYRMNRQPETPRPEPAKPPKKKGKAKIIAAVIVLLVLLCAAFGALVYFDVIKVEPINNFFISAGLKSDGDKAHSSEPAQKPDKPDETEPSRKEDTTEPTTEAPTETFTVEESIIGDKAEIVNKIKADDASGLTEAQAYSLLKDRGFSGKIKTEYTMDGDYIDAIEIAEDSDEKHPVYNTYYSDKNGGVWIITLVNDRIFANPFSYNTDEYNSLTVFVSETATLLNYDGKADMFYEIEPDENALMIQKVKSIDSDTLDEIEVGGDSYDE